MKHHSLLKWEKKLYKLLNEVDYYLEAKYGDQYRRHPARPAHGQTSSLNQDGLFSVTSNFSLGLGSERGKGYIIKIKIVTLQNVQPEIQQNIEQDAVEKIRQLLTDYFPDRELYLERDNSLIKLYGDLSLGSL